jgi:acyl-CoA hydrolase
MPASAAAPLAAQRADASATCLRVPVTAAMACPLRGTMHPGELLKLIDVAGCVPAKRHLANVGDPVTASLDRINYHAPVHAWDVVNLDARLTRVWRTSMETRVVVTAWSFRTGEQRLVATAYLVAVAMQPQGRGKLNAEAIAPLQAITPEDHWLSHSAEQRRQFRHSEQHQAHWLALQPNTDTTLTERHVPMGPCDGNGLGQAVFGGVLLEHMHLAACYAMAQHLGEQPYIVVRQDRTDFVAPAFTTDTLILRAHLTATWCHSAEVQVECYALAPTATPGHERLVATTYMVFVALAVEGSGVCPMPAWQPQTSLQQQRSQAAQLRKQQRQADEALYQLG